MFKFIVPSAAAIEESEKHEVILPSSPASISRLKRRVLTSACDASSYITQVCSAEMDAQCWNLLTLLMKFQHRKFKEAPLKAKARLRLIAGLHECTKHVRMGHVKMLVIPYDLEIGDSPEYRCLVEVAREKQVPFCFSLTRRQLGQIVGRAKTDLAEVSGGKVQVSCVAILCADGAHQEYTQLRTSCILAHDEWLRQQDWRLKCQNGLHPGKVSEVCAKTGIFPLFLAAWCGWDRLACQLLTEGADPFQRTFALETVWHAMAWGGCLELAKLMNNQDWCLKADAEGRRPIWLAMERGHIHLYQHLIKNDTLRNDEWLLAASLRNPAFLELALHACSSLPPAECAIICLQAGNQAGFHAMMRKYPELTKRASLEGRSTLEWAILLDNQVAIKHLSTS